MTTNTDQEKWSGILTLGRFDICLIFWPLSYWTIGFMRWNDAGWIWLFGPLRVSRMP